MELDDLKKAWQQQTPEDINVRNDKKITDMIQNKSYGPLASMKARYERQLIIIFVMYSFAIIEFILQPQAWQHLQRYNVFFVPIWVIISVLAILITAQIWNYILIRKMQTVQKPIKQDLENKLTFIDRSLKIENAIGLCLFVLIGIGIETLTQRYKNSNYKNWYNVSIYLRMLAYIAIVVFGYFWQKYLYKTKFGKDIYFMRDTLSKME